MTIEVGQTICNGQLVVAQVDDNDNITVVIPQDKDQFGNPETITYSPGVTEAFITGLAKAITG